MKRLDIDFVERAPWHLPRRRLLLLLLLGVALLLSALLLAGQWRQLDQQLAATTQAIALARREVALRTPPPAPPLLLSEAQVVAVNGAIGQLNTPWPALLDGFERVATAEVALLQIEPDPRRRLIKGVAEARDHQRMLDYLAALGAVAPFAGAMVTRQEVNEKDPNRPLRFMFEALLDDRSVTAAQGGEPSGDQPPGAE